MPTAVAQQEPRRGGRLRKQPEVLKSAPKLAKSNGKTSSKKNATENEDGDDESELSELSDDAGSQSGSGSESESELSELEDEPVNGKSNGKGKIQKTGPFKNGKKAPAKKKTAVKPKAAGDAPSAEQGVDGIKTDNGLFNAMLMPDIALQSFVEEWVEAYLETGGDEEAENQTINELVIFFIRCCGLNSDVDSDEAVDRDGIVDLVERIQDEAIASSQTTYPLISRTKGIKPFRNNLKNFLEHLIITLSASPMLYQTPTHKPRGVKHVNPLVAVIQNWLVAMSSCHYRSIRHTATFIILKLKTAFCKVAVQISKDLSAAQRQRDAETKKSGKGAKLADAEKRVKESHGKKMQIEHYMDEFLDATFVFRSRDSDAQIRTDCMHELGVWMKAYPERFVDLKYMYFYDWSLTDSSSSTRLETIKGLMSLYTDESNISNVRAFTLRVTPRLLQIALRDIEINVRVAAILALTAIEKAELLSEDDEEGRERIAWLIFDEEIKIQRAIGEMVKIIWSDLKEDEQKAYTSKITKNAGSRGKKQKNAAADNGQEAELAEDEVDSRFGWKALATLLVKTSKDLDAAISKAASASQPETQATMITMDDIAATVSATSLKGTGVHRRAVAAVESLWNEIEQVQKWDTLVAFLLLDHSEADGNVGSWALEEEEETFLISMLLAILERTASEAAHKKVEDDSDITEQTQVLIKALPRFFAKHHADTARMADILQLPRLIKLDMYLELRMSNAYDNLWDDVNRQFLQQTDSNVLQTAMSTIGYISRNTSMVNANKIKMGELEETLMSSLRDAVAGRDVASATFSDDEIVTVEAIMHRLSLLAMSKDLVETLEDVEGGQSSGWEIILAFAERGKFGYGVEVNMVTFALQTLSAFIAWSAKRFSKADVEHAEAVRSLEAKRDQIGDLFEEFAIGDRSNAKEGVRRRAFFCFINLHIIFSVRAGVHERPAAKALPLEMDDSNQFRLAGRLLATIERFASDLEEEAAADVVEPDTELDDDATPRPEKQAKQPKKVQINLDGDDVPFSRREAEYAMLQDVAIFISAIRVGLIEAQHSSLPLTHYGRFGSAYDACVKTLIDVLRDEGIYNKDGEMTQKVVGQALQDSFDIYLDSRQAEPTATLTLGKVAAGAFIIHGNHFKVLQKIDPKCLTDFHIDAVEWIANKLARGIRAEKAAQGGHKATAHKAWCNAIFYFRVLAPLLNGVSGQAALRIKTKMTEAFAGADIKPSASNKAWDAQRSYEKRLISLASKDPTIKTAAAAKSKKRGKSPANAGEEEDDDDARRAAGSPVPPKRPKSAPAKAAKSSKAAPVTTRTRIERKAKQPLSASMIDGDDDEEEEEEEDTEDEEDREEGEDAEHESDAEEEETEQAQDEIVVEEVPSAKRPREDEVSNVGSDERRRSPSEASEPGTQQSRVSSIEAVGARPIKKTRRA